MTPYWIFIIFLISFGLTDTIFAEPVDLEIDWIIEGQISKVESVPADETGVNLITENNSLVEEQIENFISPENKISDEIAEDYITGSKYMLGNKEITIDSKIKNIKVLVNLFNNLNSFFKTNFSFKYSFHVPAKDYNCFHF